MTPQREKILSLAAPSPVEEILVIIYKCICSLLLVPKRSNCLDPQYCIKL
jgi:hypothetical protein